MAKNYNKSDYARNKYSEGIVYSSVTGAYELIESQFLAENPHLTSADFEYYKNFSDCDYLEALRTDTIEGRLVAVSAEEISETKMASEESVEDEYIRLEDEASAPTHAYAMAVLDACLTETQKRRYITYVCQELTLRDIAAAEGVDVMAAQRSIDAAKKKIKKYLKK